MKSKIILISIIYILMYPIILLSLTMYLHALTWDGGAKTVVEKTIWYFAFLIFPISNHLINNAILFFTLNYATSVSIVCIFSFIILKFKKA